MLIAIIIITTEALKSLSQCGISLLVHTVVNIFWFREKGGDFLVS
jgi:hypothetical protein